MDTETSYSYTLEYTLSGQISYHVFQSYQNVEWGNNPIPDYMDEYEYYIDYIDKLYHYKVTIGFQLDEMGEDETIDQIVFNINGNKHVKEIEGIKFDYSQEGLPSSPLVKNNMMFRQIHLTPNREGELSIKNIWLETLEDIKIIDFYTLNDNIEVKKIIVETNESIEWKKGDSIIVPGKTDLKIDATLFDENFVDRLYYYNMVDLVMVYEIDGNKVYEVFEFGLDTVLNAYEILASEIDETSILSYYYDYKIQQ